MISELAPACSNVGFRLQTMLKNALQRTQLAAKPCVHHQQWWCTLVHLQTMMVHLQAAMVHHKQLTQNKGARLLREPIPTRLSGAQHDANVACLIGASHNLM